jgi:hypothetical protein
LSLWFAGLAALGLLRSWATVYRQGEFDLAAKLWLAGSIGMALVAFAAWRRTPRG